MSKNIQKANQLPRKHFHFQHLESFISHTKHQMLQGDFIGAINTGEPLLNYLPKQSPKRAEVLGLLGLAHGILQHYERSYDLLTEAVALDPTNADFWYNHGLACEFTTRFAQATHSYERAAKFLGNASGELSQKVAHALKMNRRQVEAEVKMYEGKITSTQYLELEKHFMHGLSLTKQSKWKEAEQAFQQLIDMGGRLPQYWGNLGVSLIMQLRYDEAEIALKHALEIDPAYTFALNNLAKLPAIRKAGGLVRINIEDVSYENDIIQPVTFNENNADDGSLTPSAIIESNEIK